MKLLLDENLSHTLVARLRDVFSDARHVTEVGLKGADDAAIWQYAIDHEFVLVTKDDDFRERSVLEGHPPKVIWLALGNCSTDLIERVLRKHHANLAAFCESTEQSLVTIWG